MTIARVAAIGSLIVGIVAVAVLMFGGGGGTEYTVHLQSANQLVKGNEVKVGGLAVGEITDIQLSEDNQADIKITVEDDFAPLHMGTEATVRVTSLPSVANRYISLHPGPNNAPEIEEGGVLETDNTTNAVDLDQLFNTLDPPTRKGLQDTLQGFAGWYVGQSDNLQDTFKYLGPSLGSLSKVMGELARDQKTFTDFVVHGARAVSAIAERRDDLAALVTNGNTFARAIAAENESFDRALAAFPDVLRQGSVTFRNLRSALDDLDHLTDVSKPQIKSNVAPFLRDLAGLVRTMRPAFEDLRYLVNRPGANNDSTDILRRFPALQRLSRESTRNSVAALKSGQDEVEFFRPYAPEISAWITHFAQVPAYYDANGHYARVLPIFNAFGFDEAANQLNALTPAERRSAQSFRGSRFCPGGATQPAPDGSNPFLDGGRLAADDCDPNIRPVGP
jgi:phospholipid/cholesterol/gamma-HCH transport system substrate-binding protein